MLNPPFFTQTRKKINLKSVLWLIIPMALSPLSFAHAYLDPGTGSYAIQLVVGILFGGAYTLKTFGGRIIDRFRHNKKQDE